MRKMYQGPVSIGKPRLDLGACIVAVLGSIAAFVSLYGVACIVVFLCMGV
jgi:hypothetical protein